MCYLKIYFNVLCFLGSVHYLYLYLHMYLSTYKNDKMSLDIEVR